MGHSPGIENFLQLFFRENFVSARRFPNGFTGRMGFLCDLRSPIVADKRRKRRDHREAALHISRQRSRLASMPVMHFSVKAVITLAVNSMDSISFSAMIGIMTFNSKLPAWPQKVMVASQPMTCAATWSTDSQITGLTLPGMIEEPGWVSGRLISPRPHLGPEASQRRSLAIFVRLTANVFSAPLAWTRRLFPLAPRNDSWPREISGRSSRQSS